MCGSYLVITYYDSLSEGVRIVILWFSDLRDIS
jgi:hypothetical protein